MAIEFDGDAIVAKINDDPEFGIVARDWTCTMRLEIGPHAWDAVVEQGKLLSFGRATERNADIAFSGSEKIWNDLLGAAPKPLLTGLTLFPGLVGLLTETGDRVRHNAPYAAAIQRIYEALRNQVSGVQEASPAVAPFKHSDRNIVGRYVYISVDGVDYRVYYEEAGEGVPLMLQHTAGCHGSQWRHMLADPELQKKYRMIAYDLPYHGNSLPPLNGASWWEESYAPAHQDLMKQVVALSHTLKLEQPIFMGCSIGGQLALDLAAFYPDEFRAFISLNGTYGRWSVPEGATEEQLRQGDITHHPRISKEYAWACNYVNTAPLASETFRREVCWVYGQGGPAVLQGDANYHVCLHDLRRDGHLIDAARKPVYVLTGEFDLALEGPGGSRQIADNIPDIRFQVLDGMGHFPMTDEPIRFREAIIPILDEAMQLTGQARDNE